MELLKYLLLLIGVTVACACVLPIYEYLYGRFINGETYNIRYYFSKILSDIQFDIQSKQYDIHPSLMCRVINNREELADMWEKEMKKKLP